MKTDEAFFRERNWYDFDECLNRVMKELAGKYISSSGRLEGGPGVQMVRAAERPGT